MPIEEITVEDLASMPPGTAFVLDVRNPEELREARVPGVVAIPLPELDARLGEVPRDRRVFVICRSGARSATAVESLHANGFDAVNVAGGTLAWIESGRAVDSGPMTD